MAPSARNVDAEEALLGAALLGKAGVVALLEHTRPEDFSSVAYGHIWEAIQQADELGIDVEPTSVAELLHDAGLLAAAGGRAALHGLVAAAPSSALGEHHARTVRKYAVLRDLEHAGAAIAHLATTEGSLDEKQAEAERLLSAALYQRAASPVRSLAQGLAEKIAAIGNPEAPVTRVSTGLAPLDAALIGGWGKGQLIIIAARPSMGKTTLGLNVCENAALAGHGVLVVSCEMSADELQDRTLARFSGIDLTRLKPGANLYEQEMAALGTATQTVTAIGRNLYVLDETPPTVTDLRLTVRGLVRRGAVDLVLIDYLQLLRAGGRHDSKTAEMTEITRALKLLARDLQVPIIALSQLNRNVEARQDKRPTLSDLRDSGSIEQDADVVLLLYRDDYYNQHSIRHGEADIEIAKHRNGPPGNVVLRFRPHVVTFEPNTAPPPRQYRDEEMPV